MANTLNLGNGTWATKEGSLLAYNDENNNFKPLPFTTTRASSATVVNKQGLIETVGSGIPRIDFSDDANGALLLEPTRSNLITYSNDFTNASWTTNNATISINQLTSPDGSLNADKITEDTSNTDHKTRDTIAFSSGSYTWSVFAKKSERNFVVINVYDGTTLFGYTFDLLNGNLGSLVYGSGSVDANIEKYGNGWYRCSISFTASSGSGQANVGTALNSSTTSYQGDGTSGVYIYGAQLEQGSYATSYIPTSGQSGGVTRVADACNNENLNVDYSGDYTLYLEHETLSITEYNQFQFRQETSISYIFRVGNSINVGSGLYSATNTIGFNKFALSVGSDGSYSFYKNGSLLSSGSGLNANLETIKSDAVGMSIKDIKLYNTRLSNAELQALTQ